jgi:hypothetical protein
VWDDGRPMKYSLLFFAWDDGWSMDYWYARRNAYVPSRKVYITVFDFNQKWNGSTICRQISLFRILCEPLRRYPIDICIKTDRRKEESLLLALRRIENRLKVSNMATAYLCACFDSKDRQGFIAISRIKQISVTRITVCKMKWDLNFFSSICTKCIFVDIEGPLITYGSTIVWWCLATWQTMNSIFKRKSRITQLAAHYNS